MRYIHFIIRTGLGLVLIWASIDKIISPAQFAEMVYHYKILPNVLVHPIAIYLPWLELITGIFLIIGFWERACLIIFNLLMFVFMLALISALFRGLDIHCGCFTVDPNAEKELVMSLIRDIILLIAGMWCFVITIRKNKRV
ncbi:MAG: Methylamine utilization protein mauE [Candidatus Magnetoglobus multicellularis str. Araruama]|uniref:Methylamine utilization protein mauE n=1 Tax=Candidatus Magnetoglobus multicellularis str. Araruama TaxID=890399 RepID=A0A1V1PGT1_9BACT|nr:MAG: Methylamine utilization protein mauE [Candidatus Magnetoglobus multicellularis str. Araruama]